MKKCCVFCWPFCCWHPSARLADEHPMAYLRINTTLQQYDEFLDFYGITEGDGMYLAPEDRVAIW